MRPSIAKVALPVPLDKQFDYIIPNSLFPIIGGRVSVPFGRQTLVGVVTALSDQSDYPREQLKSLKNVLDQQPLWEAPLYKLLVWCSQYYQYPLGETLANALPSALRKGKPAQHAARQMWHLTELGKQQSMQSMGRAVKQAKVLHLLAHGPLEHQAMIDADISRSVLNALCDKGWIRAVLESVSVAPWPSEIETDQDKPKLNQEQAIAIAAVNSESHFACYLLDGVTGSGKTEVYLNMIAAVLERGKQALVLVPEIGLTPQTIQRFARRFRVPISVIHSNLNDSERLNAWLDAKSGRSGIVIGTRSALMTPFADLGIIIVDEEHDASYKQQDSLRYHARDVAVMRANHLDIPVVLGSATPSFETLHNAHQGKYRHLHLTERAGVAVAPKSTILDIKGLYLDSGLSAPLIAQMRRHLEAGNQVMLFLNRRGFSPALMCHECGWLAECQRCDAYYTFHQHDRELRCHHCGSSKPVLHQCQSCGSTQMISVGVGTEQLEQQLQQHFPQYQAIRIDRDSTRRKGSLESSLTAIRQGKYQILIGTQMLAKGHHFPDVTLVALLDVDGALYSSDFRASERFAQLFVQVSGRAGRASKPGEVILQTHHPEHPLLLSLIHRDYGHFANNALRERQLAQLPPFSFLALFKAESNHNEEVELFLRQVRATLEAHPLCQQHAIEILGPAPSPIAKRAGKFRWQLLVQAPSRPALHQLLFGSKTVIATLPNSKKVRWHIDIEPQDLS
ncbi:MULTISPECIES: primosomal protein N' [unclassified Vibrio]|uniref:Replication restart protein PriA n=1 Tax=Vibrio sp. HB236076 TaxID=3232307 RepID=A0AB39HH54_9VIBR|nr:primosomal protein N' [Vibrio sp. HB161653]MDP5255788.1 primosomal protein N' [Vibrio sp. HB161653]